MIDLSQIVGFDWDDGNSQKNAAKHHVLQTEAEQVFVNAPLLLLEDKQHSMSEPRFHAYGRTNDGRLLQVAFTLRLNGSLLRVISIRPMSAKERACYAQET